MLNVFTDPADLDMELHEFFSATFDPDDIDYVIVGHNEDAVTALADRLDRIGDFQVVSYPPRDVWMSVVHH